MGEAISMDEALAAFQELQLKQSELSKTFKSLQSSGVEGDYGMPQLIIFGMQSSGKSSVLERISRTRFPTDKTRFVTEIMLHRRLSPEAKITYESAPSSNSVKETLFTTDVKPDGFTVSNEFSMIEKIHKDFLEERADATPRDYVLKIEIAGPSYPDMTFVELPGLRTSGKDESPEEDSFVHGLAEKYMKNKASLILAVLSAKVDYRQQEEVLKVVERFDPNHERTLGIVTHTDTLQLNSEEENTFIELVKNKKARLKLGWHALRNGPSDDRYNSEDLCNKKEMEFFRNGSWAAVPTCCVGLGALQTRLNRAIFDRMKEYIPDMVGNVEKKISENKAKLEKLGPPRATIQEQRAYLLGISSKCERIIAQALNGTYSDGFFTSEARMGAPDFRKLRSVIRDLNEDFAEAIELRGAHRIITDSDTRLQIKESLKREAKPYLDGWEPVYITRTAFEAEVAEQARRSRGVEMPGHINQYLVESLFRIHSKPWEEIARRHVMTVGEVVEHFVHSLFEYLADEQVLPALSCAILDPALNKMKDMLLGKLEELTASMKEGHPQLLGRTYLTQIQKSQSKRQFQDLARRLGLPLDPNQNPSTVTVFLGDLQRPTSNPELPSSQVSATEIIDLMQAYYDLAIVIFMNNVANLAIENCLLRPLESIFTSITVINMDDEHIEDLASEPTAVREQRDLLNYQLEKLQTGLSTLKSYEFSQPRPEGLNVFPELHKRSIFTKDSVFSLYANRKRDHSLTTENKDKGMPSTTIPPTGGAFGRTAVLSSSLAPVFSSTSVTSPSTRPLGTLTNTPAAPTLGSISGSGFEGWSSAKSGFQDLSIGESSKSSVFLETDSSDWGNKKAAAARASVEPTVTCSNEQLVRTYHPSLSQVDGVYAVQDSYEKWIWVVAPGPKPTTMTTHAGGREIHLYPVGITEHTTTMWRHYQSDPRAALNSRKFLSPDDLHVLREMFPSAVGVRVFMSGFVVILFKTRVDIEKSWLEDGFASEFGNLRLRYDVLEAEPTQKVLFRGAAVASQPDCLETNAALGLKIRFASGQNAITVPTHAFVTFRTITTSPMLRIANWYTQIKRRLARFAPIRRGPSEPVVGTARHQPTITTDSHLEDLPRVVSSDHTPRVVGWGSYKDVLDGRPVFATGFNIATGNITTRSGHGVSGRAQRAIVEGSQYLWDREALSQNVSILWRTENDEGPLGGLSGTALCLGQPSDRTCLAVCFQNFETPLYSRAYLEDDHRGPPPEYSRRPRVKGGFLLPADVRAAEILCDEAETSFGSGTYPTRERASTELRRSFSSHH
ncbi:hypothetical protein CNMCM5793_008806 [Aspergillus hiratsukae]|uniref:GED domain-containing protein n=1 Tax=Aspergillus hiratsukae TaxID=1194566 RepID=A0A8H6UAV5_9EURO|nr:hypothetical protein CNMCM5793_008806 [Aspergillus hiratsukae]KAF7162482.1 hypothetical protein CNMCM6106_009399 [Aspergillus hiratsukae]